MSSDPMQLFSVFGFFIVLVFVAGFYCILATRSMMRAIIGLELLIKAVTLLIIAAGYITNNMGVAQSIVITIIVIEVVIMTIAGGIAISMFRHTDNLDLSNLKKLKG